MNSTLLDPLAHYNLAVQPDDAPASWTARLRTGMATLAAAHAGAEAGLHVLELLFPGGPDSAGLMERDQWARLLLRTGQVEAAIRVARDRQAERDSYLPRLIILEAHLAAGNLPAAREEAAGIGQISGPNSVAPANAEGAIALRERDAVAAEEAFRRALAIRPDNVPALEGLADALALSGDVEGAVGVLQDAVQIAGAEARPALLLRLAELQQADNDAAAALLREALEALAERLRAELEQVRSAPKARPRRTGNATIGPVTPHDRQLADPGLIAQAQFDRDEVPPEELSRALFEHFGHAAFRPGQAAVLRSVLTEGRDTLALMPTGAGKSLCFQLPAVLLPGVVLVVSPLVALMADQLAGLAEVPGLAGRATLINSTLPADELDARLTALAGGAYSLVYAAPERLRQATMLRALRRAGVSLLVIDEAHCLCLWGHAFRPDYLAIGRLASALGVPRILAVTATATPAMQAEIAHSIDRSLTVVNTGVLRENLFLEVRQLASESEKRTSMIEFVRATPGPGIVYATSRDKCEQLASMLRKFGVQAAHYHAGLPAAEREETQNAFMAGRIRVLVATVAFGMGVNKRDVRFIIHYHPARSLEAYTQEAGRAGRDGQPAHCLLLATPADKGTLTRRSHEDHLDLESLRALYAGVRRAVREAAGGPIDLGALQAAEGNRYDADTAVRVGLSALERAGFITRGLDCSGELTVRLAAEPVDPRLAALAQALDLRPGRPMTVTAVQAATILQEPVDAVEDVLAAWQEAGLLDYRAGRRGVLVRIVEPPPADGSARLADLLRTYEKAAESRARALVRYIESPRCRNITIAQHFGENVATACGRCDICRPEGRRSAKPPASARTSPRASTMAPQDAILQLVAELPFRAGRNGLGRILSGSSASAIGPDRCRLHGALGGMTIARIVAEIDGLLADGLLESVDTGKFTCVALTDRGRSALHP